MMDNSRFKTVVVSHVSLPRIAVT